MVVVFDLDDTLYDELCFIKSGFREISRYLDNSEYYDFMLQIFENEGSGRVFNRLIEEFSLDISLQKLIEIYRFHIPDISLPKESIKLLDFAKKYKTALISDSHYIMQNNKFTALELSKYIDFPIFTDFHHTKKPELKPFELVMSHFKDESDFIYISDNPKKDFIAPKKLRWQGIRFKNPHGVYREIKNSTDFEVSDRLEIIDIIKEIENKIYV